MRTRGQRAVLPSSWISVSRVAMSGNLLDADTASAVAGPVRNAAYGPEDPLVASNLVGTTRLAFPIN